MKKLFAVYCFVCVFAVSAFAQTFKITEPYDHSEKSGKLSSNQTKKYTYLYDTSLIQAIKLQDEQRVTMLLYAQVSPNEKNDEGFTPLYFAAQYMSPEILTMLLDRGARVNLASKYDITPLMAAAHAGRADNVKVLLEYGADPNLVDAKNLTALQHAINKNNSDVVELLAPITTVNREKTLPSQEDTSEVVALTQEVEPEVEPDLAQEENQEEGFAEEENQEEALAEEEPAEEIAIPAPAYNPTLAEIDSKIEQTRQALARLINLRKQIIHTEEQTLKEYEQLKNSKK